MVEPVGTEIVGEKKKIFKDFFIFTLFNLYYYYYLPEKHTLALSKHQ